MEQERRTVPRRQRPDVRPWVRFWARTIDGFLLLVSVLLPVALAFPLLGVEIPELALGLLLMISLAFAEALLLSTWGWTPGKALLRVRVRTEDGATLSFGQALARALEVLVIGQGLGLPVITLITQLYAYTRLKAEGTTRWDRSGGFVVSHQAIGPLRTTLAVAFLALFVALVVLASLLPEA